MTVADIIYGVLHWAAENWIELVGAALGAVYTVLSIRQHILTWPVGLLTSAFYIVIFFQAKFYANMGLQFYYLGVSIYGWYYWLHGQEATPDSGSSGAASVSRVPAWMWPPLIAVTVIIFAAIAWLRFHYEADSGMSVYALYGDAFTFATGITATWMLARKYIENWLLWIVADTVAVVLFINQALWPTVGLYTIYTVMAVAGYFQWRRSLWKQQ
ncbi:MAG: nicotinamide riboside transporter PnuC [Bacteroidales bacterium]|jgi:nicotinamide mononucleotide transporter|nr:nicotinamide riboside transporter PnuC [Bacteroidales bacterium]